MLRIIRQQWLLWFYLLLTGSIIAAFIKPLEFEHTTAGIIVGTIITTVGAVLLAAVPAYLVAGVLAGIIRLPGWLQSLTSVSVYILAGHAVDHSGHYRISAVLQHPGFRLVHAVGDADPAAAAVPHLGDRVFANVLGRSTSATARPPRRSAWDRWSFCFGCPRPIRRERSWTS
jgi:hypothetical protein